MVSQSDLKEIGDGVKIYQEKFDQKIDQSSIYESINFTCVDKAYPGIVLTPICDIITKRVPYVKIVQIISAKWVYEKYLLSKELSEEQIIGVDNIPTKQLRSIRREFVTQYIKNRTYRYHFLPKLKDILGNSFIDFQMVQTMYPEHLEKCRKIAALKSPWRESVPSRYAAYCLRIGTPRYSKEFMNATFDSISSLK